jgi:ATP-dependent RNA helicase DDX5/DBP2
MSYYDSRQQGGGGWNSSNGSSAGVGGGVGGYYGSAPLGGGGVGSGWYNAPASAPTAANPYGSGAYSGSYYGGGSSGGGGSTSYGSSSLGSSLKQVDFSAVDLVPFEKDFYIEHPDVSKRPESEAAQWRASKQIVVVGQGVPKPVLTFEEASMPQYILSEVLKQGFERPTPIQSQGWPMALKGKNMVGISATGSGKTLAFLLPAMIHINAQASIYSIQLSMCTSIGLLCFVQLLQDDDGVVFPKDL